MLVEYVNIHIDELVEITSSFTSKMASNESKKFREMDKDGHNMEYERNADDYLENHTVAEKYEIIDEHKHEQYEGEKELKNEDVFDNGQKFKDEQEYDNREKSAGGKEFTDEDNLEGEPEDYEENEPLYGFLKTVYECKKNVSAKSL